MSVKWLTYWCHPLSCEKHYITASLYITMSNVAVCCFYSCYVGHSTKWDGDFGTIRSESCYSAEQVHL